MLRKISLIGISLLGFFVLILSIDVYSDWRIRTFRSTELNRGYLLYNDLSSFSLLTGESHKLIPSEIDEGRILRTPVIGMASSTVYYVDQSEEMIMSYRYDHASPKKLYPLPIWHSIDWLLLNPDEDTLFFSVDQEQQCPTYSILIEYDLQTNQPREIRLPYALNNNQCPIWRDRSTLLVLTANETIETLDIQSGQLTPIMNHAGYFALSGSGKRLLVNTPGSAEYVLYAFPTLKKINQIPPELFQKYTEIGSTFSFIDEDHLLFSLWFDPLDSFGTVWLDLRSLEYLRIAKPGFVAYLSEYPLWRATSIPYISPQTNRVKGNNDQ